MSDELKTGREYLDDYFKELKEDQNISESIRELIFTLWEQKKLFTKTSLVRALDDLRKEVK